MKKHAIIFFSVIIFVLAISLICVFFFVLYPKKYNNFVKKYSTQFNLPQELVYSVINVESGFNKNAVSSVGAKGLMQLMPSTASEVALKLGEQFSEENLFNAETNIRYGCFYLKYLMDMFSNNITNVVASYNAGFNNVIMWLENSDYSKNGNLTSIPLTETKNYVKKINNNLKVYGVIAKS